MDKALEGAVVPADSLEWRKWLEENHSTSSEAWLVFYKRNSGRANLSYDEALEEAICFGWIDGKVRTVDEERYMQRFSPRRPGSVWSKRNREIAGELVSAGRMTPAGLSKIEEARKNGKWDTAYPKRPVQTLPDDLREALEADPEAWEFFRNLANSYRNNYIGWVNAAKTEPTRQKRMAEVVKRSRLNQKPGML